MAVQITITGLTIQLSTRINVLCDNSEIAVGDQVSFSGLTTATMLNGQTRTVVAVYAQDLTQAYITPNPPGLGLYQPHGISFGNHPETGFVTVIEETPEEPIGRAVAATLTLLNN